MSAQPKKWIVRDDVGHIYGPFDSLKLRDLIQKGVLTGDEETALYPAGDWQPMSAEPELYNLILESLQTEKKKPELVREEPLVPKPEMQKREEPREEKKKAPEVEVVPNITKRKKTPRTAADDEATKIQMEKKPHLDAEVKSAPGVKPLTASSSPTIELTDRENIFNKMLLRANIIPIILLLLAGFLFYVGSNVKKANHKSAAVNLLAPHPRQGGNAARGSALVKAGAGYFYKDTYSNYIRAEENFVEAVEESPDNAQAILMLILTDLELWPFSKQDSSDQDTLQGLLQMISRIDRYGTRRSVASPAVELTLGHDSKARTEIDSALTAQPAEGSLYALKGQTFFDSNDYAQAISYYDKAASLIPPWVKSVYLIGLSYSKLGNGAQAQQYLIQALKLNPSHPAARLELGVVESRFFGHDDKAREYLSIALDGEEKLLPSVEARGRLALAAILAKAGDTRAAKKQLKIAAQLSPSDPDLRELQARLGETPVGQNVENDGSDREHMVLGDQYMRSRNFLGAQAQYKAAFGADPHNARASMKVAEALWKLHQSSEAIEFLQKSINADPKFIESYVLMADYKSQRYDFEGAARALEQALKKNPKSYEVFRGYGELSYRRGDFASAEVYIGRALQLYEIDLASNLLMSKIQAGKKELVKATQYAKKAIDIDRGDAEAQVNYAKVIAVYESVKEATEYLRELINTYPTDLDLRIGLADVLIQDEQFSAGEQILKQVVVADDANKEAFLLYGDAEVASGQFNEALNYYLAAARVDPSDPTALFRAGEVYLKAGRASDAQKQFQLVLRVNNMFPRTHYNLARAYFSQGYTDEALKELDQEKKLNPKLADPYEFAGDILLSTRKFQGAAREYQKSSEIKPQGATIYVKLAKAYRGQGSYDEAMAMLRLAAARESGYADIYKEYGYIYDAKGMAPEAIANFERYLRLEPNSPDKETIRIK